jgi:phospholipid/cholesterol/gamma-HCH transport system ATP-binding protein
MNGGANGAPPPQAPASSLEPVVVFDDVSIGFEQKPVLENISFQVRPGEMRILLGPAGVGKSVLLKLTNGLLRPDSGRIFVFGKEISAMREQDLFELRGAIGTVFQEGALFDSLSVYENVAYRLREEGLKPEGEVERRVREVLRFVEMEDAIDKMPSELSGGMRRRVAIARAIISQPEIMLYDSPTAGLDPVTSHTITMQIAKLRDVQHVTSLVVTHRLQDAFVLANYVYLEQKAALVPLQSLNHGGPPPVTRFLLLREGEAYFQGTAQELAATHDNYLLKFLA